MEVAAGVHRLTTGVVNWYVVDDGGKLLLIDAGKPADWDLLVLTVGRLGRRLADVEAILLTHAHSDHTGFAEQARSTAGSTVWIHAGDLEMAKGTGVAPKHEAGVGRYLHRAELYRTFISLARGRARKVLPIRELSTFSDGEVLDLPGKPRVVHTPGHTRGSATIHLPDSRALVTGDALVTRNPLTGRVGPQVMPAGLNQDSAGALSALGALEHLDAELVLPGHGEPWTEGAAAAVQGARRAGFS